MHSFLAIATPPYSTILPYSSLLFPCILPTATSCYLQICRSPNIIHPAFAFLSFPCYCRRLSYPVLISPFILLSTHNSSPPVLYSLVDTPAVILLTDIHLSLLTLLFPFYSSPCYSSRCNAYYFSTSFFPFILPHVILPDATSVIFHPPFSLLFFSVLFFSLLPLLFFTLLFPF
jgi:hypothetical protein